MAPDQVLDAALEFAERIAANGPLGLAATKELVRLAAYGAPDADERLAEWQQRVFTSEDAKEGRDGLRGEAGARLEGPLTSAGRGVPPSTARPRPSRSRTSPRRAGGRTGAGAGARRRR